MVLEHYRIFLVLAEFGHSDWIGGILRKKRKNSAKIGMVGSYATSIKYEAIHLVCMQKLGEIEPS